MDFKKLRKRLAAEAKAAGICAEWLEKIKAAPSREYLLQLFIKGLDFAILNDFPSDELAAEFNDIAPHFGIFINRPGDWETEGKKRVIARDTSMEFITFRGYEVGEVYALRGSRLTIRALGNALVAVTVEPGAYVETWMGRDARVTIYDHGGEIYTRDSHNVQIKRSN